eukprot:TRINITY_DN8160_c0_g1_i10.p1 TRINITY_DN8160_c0_g1~~TRINITY_DN8160_c0_g1_i10.p1  ORF type:complete len:381 (-),score=64.92 TRINITY_DN8160_c0_g1_i10:400-1542(-)
MCIRDSINAEYGGGVFDSMELEDNSETPSGCEQEEDLFEQASFGFQRSVRRVSALSQRIAGWTTDQEALAALRAHLVEEAVRFVESATLLEVVLRQSWCEMQADNEQRKVVLQALQLLYKISQVELRKVTWGSTVKEADWEMLGKFSNQRTPEDRHGVPPWVRRHRYAIAGVCAASAATMGYLWWSLGSPPVEQPEPVVRPVQSPARVQIEAMEVPFPLAPLPLPPVDRPTPPMPISAQVLPAPMPSSFRGLVAASGGLSMLAAGLVLNTTATQDHQQTSVPQLRSRFAGLFAEVSAGVLEQRSIPLELLVPRLERCYALDLCYERFTEAYSCSECCICLTSMGPCDDVVCSSRDAECSRCPLASRLPEVVGCIGFIEIV